MPYPLPSGGGIDMGFLIKTTYHHVSAWDKESLIDVLDDSPFDYTEESDTLGEEWSSGFPEHERDTVAAIVATVITGRAGSWQINDVLTAYGYEKSISAVEFHEDSQRWTGVLIVKQYNYWPKFNPNWNDDDIGMMMIPILAALGLLASSCLLMAPAKTRRRSLT